MNMQPTTERSSLHDFDFLVGKWRVEHRQLKVRLGGSDEWRSFEGSCEMRMTMNGHGNLDDNFMDLPGGAYRAMGVRAFDAGTNSWAIWWLDARNPRVIEPPVVGRFENGIGTFIGDDTFDGRPIRVRFIWSAITAHSARWEQAFSPDGGRTWETNWRMEFTRMA